MSLPPHRREQECEVLGPRCGAAGCPSSFSAASSASRCSPLKCKRHKHQEVQITHNWNASAYLLKCTPVCIWWEKHWKGCYFVNGRHHQLPLLPSLLQFHQISLLLVGSANVQAEEEQKNQAPRFQSHYRVSSCEGIWTNVIDEVAVYYGLRACVVCSTDRKSGPLNPLWCRTSNTNMFRLEKSPMQILKISFFHNWWLPLVVFSDGIWDISITM